MQLTDQDYRDDLMLEKAQRLTGRPVTNSALSQHNLMIALLLEGIDSGNLSAEALDRGAEDGGMSKDNGGPAFPVPVPQWDERDGYTYPEEGMTIRDYFAGKAMHSIAAEQMNADVPEEVMPDFWRAVAKYSYMAADAMLKEREK